MNSKSFCAFLCASLFFILLAAMCLDGGNLLRISFIVHVTVGLMMLTYLVGKKQKNNQKNNEEDKRVFSDEGLGVLTACLCGFITLIIDIMKHV